MAAALIGAALAGPGVGPPAAAERSDPRAPEVTAGTNGAIAWTKIIRDASGAATDGYLSSSTGDTYFHLADTGAIPRDPEWSPDGTRIVYWSYGSASADGLWVVAHPFGETSYPYRLTEGGFDSDPTWSPDGSRIAFVRTQAGVNGIFVVPIWGGTPVQVLRDSRFFGEDLTWSPDGTKIAFADYSGDPFTSPLHIYVMDADGGTPVDLGVGLSPSWSPDGTKIVFEYVYSSADHDIYWMNPDGTGRVGLLTSSTNEWEPAWSPDGTRIAFHTAAGIHAYTPGTGGVVSVASGSDLESTTWGADQPVCQGRAVTVGGTAGNDTLRGSTGVDVIHGLAGNDTILGLQGQDVVCGGAGTDTVSYAGQTAPARAVIGETDPSADVSDLIAADVENLTGGAGPDTLFGDDSANLIQGGRGDDTVLAAGGVDTVSGGGGEDTLVGDDGDDQLSGEGGDDVLRGGDGGDTMTGGDDADQIAGGPGTDTVDYTGRAQPVDVTVGSGPGNDGGKVDGAAGDRDTVRGSVENVTGGNGADTLVGNDLNNQLRGNLGADTLRGGEGRDLLRAQDGVRDLVIDCGADVDAEAVRDGVDPAPISCP
ncbi:PD40 domain-containing protein [Nocardioides antri]|nr:PD40 domain-containing protein [Nocardioides antri]